MPDPYRNRRLLASALMVSAVVPFALGCWRLYVWRWGQTADFVRYEPSPLLAEWDRLSKQHKARTADFHRDNPQANVDNETSLRNLEMIRVRLVEDQDNLMKKARRLEMRLGLYGLAGAIVLFSAGYWRRDKLPTVG